MLRVEDVELAGVRSSFCMLVARWRLTQRDVRELLGGDPDGYVEGRILPDILGTGAESRMRLLLRLSGALDRLAPGVDICDRMRSRLTGDGATPLSALGDLQVLRAAVRMAESNDQPPTASRFG